MIGPREMLSDPFLPRRRSLSTPHGILDPCRAVQSQGGLSPPHSEAAAPGDQLGRVRRRPARPRQPDRLVHAGGDRGLEAEPRTTRGGQPSYSDLAIATALTLRAVFRLALRQTEGLIGSVLQLLGLDLPVPDHRP